MEKDYKLSAQIAEKLIEVKNFLTANNITNLKVDFREDGDIFFFNVNEYGKEDMPMVEGCAEWF